MTEARLWHIKAFDGGDRLFFHVEAENAMQAKLRAQELLYDKYGKEWRISAVRPVDNLYK